MTLIKQCGILHYNLKLDDGRPWRRHIDQIRKVRPLAGFKIEEVESSNHIDFQQSMSIERHFKMFTLNEVNYNDCH